MLDKLPGDFWRIADSAASNPAGQWNSLNNARDGNTGTAALGPVQVASGWSAYLELTYNRPLIVDKLRYFVNANAARFPTMEVSLYHDDIWTTVHNANFTRNAYTTITPSNLMSNVTKSRIRFNHLAGGTDMASVAELQVNEVM